MSFEVGKTYLSTIDGEMDVFRVDHIQAVEGRPLQAVGVKSPGTDHEFMDYEYLEYFSEDEWTEL